MDYVTLDILMKISRGNLIVNVLISLTYKTKHKEGTKQSMLSFIKKLGYLVSSSCSNDCEVIRYRLLKSLDSDRPTSDKHISASGCA